MSSKKTLWIPLAGSIALLLLLVLGILYAGSAPSLADDSPQAPADVEGIDSWTWSGPSHNTAAGLAPQVNAIVMQPGTPSIIYAATNQGVYRSTDTGSTWEPRNQGLGGWGELVVTDLEIDPTDHERLVIGTWGAGLFESTDAGLHWTRLPDPLASADLQPSAAPPPGAPQVPAAGPSNLNLSEVPDLLKKPLSSGDLLPERRPAAENLVDSPQTLPVLLSWTRVRQVAMHPSFPSQLFACIDSGYGVYVSYNSGGSWSPVTNLPTESCRTYTFAPSDSDIRYASFGSWEVTEGFFRTENGGDSWEDVGTGWIGGTVTAVAIHPSNPNIVLAATSDYGLFRSGDGGDTWANVSTPSSLPDVDFYSVAFAPSSGNIAYAGGHDWAYRSDDAGASWVNADPSLVPPVYVSALAIHPTSPSTVLVGAGYYIWGGVYRRTIDGSAFSLMATGMTDTFVLDIEQDPNDANVLYAATWGAGAFRSDDGGLTWNARLAVPYIYTLEATQGPEGSTILYAGTFYSDWGIYKSWDRGVTWEQVSGDYPVYISFDLMSLDEGPDHLVAATHHGVHRSDNGGETWVAATGLSEGVVLKLAQSPFDTDRLLAATAGGGVWSSGNGGLSWSDSSTGLSSPYVYDVAFSPHDNTAYAATLGVYRSEDGGASWFPSGISDSYIRVLDTLGPPGYDVFAGTVDRGVYMAPEGSNWWFDLNEDLGELRIRSLLALDYDTLFAGTNGRGAWEYTIAHRPRPMILLPLIMKNHSTSYEEVILSETFEGTFPGGWIVDDGNSEDGLYYWAKRTCRPYSGSYSGWAAGAGSSYLGCGSDYRNNMEAWMISPSFSLADASGATLSLKLWLNLEEGWDQLWLLGSNDGQNFYGGYIDENTPGWASLTDLDLADLVGWDIAGSPQFWFALIFVSDGSVTEAEGAYVDDIVITKYSGGTTATSMETDETLPVTLHKEPAVISRP